MIVKVLELEKDKARLVIQGQGHTFSFLTRNCLSQPKERKIRFLSLKKPVNGSLVTVTSSSKD